MFRNRFPWPRLCGSSKSCFLSLTKEGKTTLMRRSIRKFNIPPPGNPPGIWTFEDWLVQIPSPRGKKAVQMPHQFVLNYLSSKTNFVFNQTLKRLSEREMLNVKLLLNPLNPAKTEKNSRAYYVRTRDKSRSNSPPLEGNVQIPPTPGTMHSQMPRGGGKLKFRIDRRMM